jgi:uncharacterized membrane protein YwaF
MITLIDGFLFSGFDPGDYTYGFTHIISIALMVLSIPLAVIYFRKQSPKSIHQTVRILAAITLAFYIIRRIIDVVQGRPFLDTFWPFYLCNVNTVFLAFILLFDIKKGRDFFLITGMSGAILMFVVPEGVFNDRFMTLQIFESLLSHYFIFIVPIILLSTKQHVLEFSLFWQSLLGLLLVLFNVEVLQELLTGRTVDYLFLRGPIDLTFWGIPQVFVMLGLAIAYVYIVIFLNHVLIGRIQVVKKQPQLKQK